MPIESPEDYELAKSALAAGEGDPVRLQKAMQRYERVAMPEKATTELGLREGSASLPELEAPQLDPLARTSPVAEGVAGGQRFRVASDVERAGGTGPVDGSEPAPFPEPAGVPDEWKPERPLEALDFIPSHLIPGGKLEIFYDMPLEAFKRKAHEERQRLIAAGAQAEAEVQMRGPQIGLNGVAQLAPIIQAGRAAQALDPDALTEDSPEYKQFVDGMWAQTISNRPPEAGPMRRHRDMGWAGAAGMGFKDRFLHLQEEGFAASHAGVRGAGRALSLGLGDPAMDAIMELGGPGQAELSRNLEEAHPIASGLGSAASVLSPSGLPSMIGRGIYGALVPKTAGVLGKAAAAGGSGAALSLLEGTGTDVTSGQLDQSLERAPLRAGLGAGAGVAGSLLASGGEALSRSIAEGAMKGTQARSVYQDAEAGGWKFDPILGIREPPSMKAARARAAADDVPVAQDIAQRARGPINDSIQTADESLRARLGTERDAYLKSTSAQVPVKNSWNTLRRSLERGDETQVTEIQRQLLDFSDVVPVDKVKLKKDGTFPEGRLYMSVEQARGLSRGKDPLSPETLYTIGSLDELPDDAMLMLTPRKMSADQLHAKSDVIRKLVESAEASSSPMATTWSTLQRGLLMDREKLPITKVVEGLEAQVPDGAGATRTVKGFAAQQAQHSEEIRRMQAERELTGALSGKRTSQTTPNDLAALNANLVRVGKKGFSVESEQALSRWAPPEIQRELALLRAANMVESIGGTPVGDNPTRAGLLRAAGDFLKPRAYGLGKALSAESAPVVSPTFPISDKLYKFLQARMPRASAFLPGMDPAKLIAEEDERMRRPKKYSDLTPEQQKLLSEAIQ